MKASERSKMVKSMEYIVRHCNNEDHTFIWLMNGVADGDIEYGDLGDDRVDDYYLENENFEYLMSLFTMIMSKANKAGGLYCDRVSSR